MGDDDGAGAARTLRWRRQAHCCGDECVCPVHGTVVFFWPAGGVHAYQDPACVHARGARVLLGATDAGTGR